MGSAVIPAKAGIQADEKPRECGAFLLGAERPDQMGLRIRLDGVTARGRVADHPGGNHRGEYGCDEKKIAGSHWGGSGDRRIVLGRVQSARRPGSGALT